MKFLFWIWFNACLDIVNTVDVKEVFATVQRINIKENLKNNPIYSKYCQSAFYSLKGILFTLKHII